MQKIISVEKSVTSRDESEYGSLLKELSELKFALDKSSIINITDERGLITFVNDKFCEISHYSRAELIGEDNSINNSGYHPREFMEKLWTTVESGATWRGDICNRAKDNSIYWVDTTIVPFVDDDGKPYQYIAFRTEITTRKLDEERIRQQASLLDKTKDAILVCDLNHRILYWNKGAELLYGWRTEEVLGKDFCEVLCGGNDEQIRVAQKKLVKSDEFKIETNQTTKSDKTVRVESRWNLVRNDRNQPDYFLIINTDITEQKKSEEQLLRAQRIESIGTLAGGIAHNLNNVLSPILMAADMLSMNRSDDDSERWISIIRENTMRGANLIKQVLSFARGVEGERVIVQVKYIIKDLVKVLQETFAKSINVKFNIAPELDLISADPTQIHQVLMNLCINARDAMPNGGTLTITAKNIRLDENHAQINAPTEAGNYIVVTVADTGTGMSPEISRRIFDPFFTTKEIGKGTGLGLSTALSIVKSHNGFLDFTSQINEGTHFTLYLPASESAETKAVKQIVSPFPTGNGELILVVDDEENIREIMKKTLEKFGYRVLTATDGVNALAIYIKNRASIALVLTDMMMPQMDGETAIQALRLLDPKLKIIAASGLKTKEQSAKLKSLAVQASLAKPFTAEKLLTTIADVLQNK